MMNKTRWSALALALALNAASASVSWAAYVVTFKEVGPNVVAVGSGSIDLSGLEVYGSTDTFGALYPIGAAEYMGPIAPTLADVYFGVTGPANFGPGYFAFASSGSGDIVALLTEYSWLMVPDGYVSGDPLSSTSTFADQTFDSLGLTPGTYLYSWGQGAADSTFTVQIDSVDPVESVVAAPEAATWAMMLAGFAFLGLAAYLRSRRPSWR
jgi:hypothetical protein